MVIHNHELDISDHVEICLPPFFGFPFADDDLSRIAIEDGAKAKRVPSGFHASDSSQACVVAAYAR